MDGAVAAVAAVTGAAASSAGDEYAAVPIRPPSVCRSVLIVFPAPACVAWMHERVPPELLHGLRYDRLHAGGATRVCVRDCVARLHAVKIWVVD